MEQGGVAEWLKAAVLKTVFVKANVGSNPTSSVNILVNKLAFGDVTERPKVTDC